MEPLLGLGGGGEKSGMSPLEAITSAAHRSLGLFAFQIGLIAGYTAIAFALPNAVGFMSEAAHIAALHAVVFILTAMLSGSLRYMQSSGGVVIGGVTSALAGSDLFPLTPLLAEAPIIVVTFSNALLLPVLGLEAWLRTEIGPNFSVLLMVQILAVAETIAVGGAGAMLICESCLALGCACLATYSWKWDK